MRTAGSKDLNRLDTENIDGVPSLRTRRCPVARVVIAQDVHIQLLGERQHVLIAVVEIIPIGMRKDERNGTCATLNVCCSNGVALPGLKFQDASPKAIGFELRRPKQQSIDQGRRHGGPAKKTSLIDTALVSSAPFGMAGGMAAGRDPSMPKLSRETPTVLGLARLFRRQQLSKGFC